MASLFGLIKKIFGGGNKPVASETVQSSASEEAALNTAKEAVSTIAEAAVAGVADRLAADGEAPATDSEVPVLAPLKMKETIDYLDRDHFVIPRSDLVKKAIDLVDDKVGGAATARAIRIFEYGVAGSHAHDLRVDREILLLGALLGQLGSDAPSKAEAFCIENGMWDALAKKVAFNIEYNEVGTTLNDVEGRALALGVAAEVANGDVDFVNAATAAETRNKSIH